jgi:transcriptional regulator with XRE-family HTH domain
MSTATRSDGQSTLREAVAEEVRATLARRRMSASALARTLGKSQTYVWRRLSGETALDTDDLEAIAGVLRIPVVELLPEDVRQGGHVSGPKRYLPERTDRERMVGRPLMGDISSVRVDPDRRPRRRERCVSPMPIMQSVAA